MDYRAELNLLRQNYLDKKISRAVFLIESAHNYAALGLYERAKTMLTISNIQEVEEQYVLKFLMIKKKIENTVPPPLKTCSLNMIVKNEEDNIFTALTSIDSIMDEIIVCDTGSNDSTIEKAKLFGVKVVHFPWNDNFSDARNHAIKHSSSDFILWMDADDTIAHEDAIKLRSLWQTSQRKATLLKVLNTQSNGSFFDFSQVRLFPRESGILFEQAIHEQVMYSLDRKDIPFSKRSDITIIHSGYEQQDTHIKKAERNLPLISKELENNPENLSLLMSKGDALTVLNRNKEAFLIYKTIIDRDDNYKINPDIFVQAHLNCANHMIKSKVDRYAIPLLEKALTLDPSRTEAMLALGNIAKKSGDFENAQQLFHRAAKITPPSRLTATPVQKIRLEAIYALTDLLIEKGNFEDAATLMTAAIKDYPNVPAFFNLSGKIFLLNQHYSEAARFYSTSLQISPENNEEARKGMTLVYEAIGESRKSQELLSACA